MKKNKILKGKTEETIFDDFCLKYEISKPELKKFIKIMKRDKRFLSLLWILPIISVGLFMFIFPLAYSTRIAPPLEYPCLTPFLTVLFTFISIFAGAAIIIIGFSQLINKLINEFEKI